MNKEQLIIDLKAQIKELQHDLSEEPDHDKNHIASMIFGEISGLRWVLDLLDDEDGE